MHPPSTTVGQQLPTGRDRRRQLGQASVPRWPSPLFFHIFKLIFTCFFCHQVNHDQLGQPDEGGGGDRHHLQSCHQGGGVLDPGLENQKQRKHRAAARRQQLLMQFGVNQASPGQLTLG